MKSITKISKTLNVAIMALVLSFSSVSDANTGTIANSNATDTWTINCQAATYYYYYFSYFLGDTNLANAYFYYYDGVGNYDYYVALGEQGTADFYINNSLSLYYYFLFLSIGDTANAEAYYYTYQAYAYYYYYLSLGDTATAEFWLNLILSYL